MENNEKNNRGRLTVIVIILAVAIIICAIYATSVITIKLKANIEGNTSDINPTNNVSKYTEVLDRIVGKYAHNESQSYITIKKENGQYTYMWYVAEAGGFRIPAPITNVIDKGNNVYELAINHPQEGAGNDLIYEAEIETVTVDMSTNEIATKQWVTIGDKVYENIVYKKASDNVSKYTKVLDKIVGTYTRHDEYTTYVEITKENGEYIYAWSQEASGGFPVPAPITDVLDKGNNIYELTINHPEEEGSPDGTYPHREAEIEKILVNLTTNEVTKTHKLTSEKMIYKKD